MLTEESIVSRNVATALCGEFKFHEYILEEEECLNVLT
jgi:hypothetical protein